MLVATLRSAEKLRKREEDRSIAPRSPECSAIPSLRTLTVRKTRSAIAAGER